MDTLSPFKVLRKKIRQSSIEIKPGNGQASVFHPETHVTYAYDVMDVERALNEYSHSVKELIAPSKRTPSPEEHALYNEATYLSAHCASPDIRGFAQAVRERLETAYDMQPVGNRVVPLFPS